MCCEVPCSLAFMAADYAQHKRRTVANNWPQVDIYWTCRPQPHWTDARIGNQTIWFSQQCQRESFHHLPPQPKRYGCHGLWWWVRGGAKIGRKCRKRFQCFWLLARPKSDYGASPPPGSSGPNPPPTFKNPPPPPWGWDRC